MFSDAARRKKTQPTNYGNNVQTLYLTANYEVMLRTPAHISQMPV